MVRTARKAFNRKNFDKARKAYDFYDFYSNLVQPPQEGLEPLVGNFWASPPDPVDPTDCDRWGDSPWCGGNPLTEAPIGIDLNIVQDECNIGIQAAGTLGFIKMPPFQIVYRSPSCIPEGSDIPPNVDENSPPYVPPPTGSGVYIFISKGFIDNYRERNNGNYYEYNYRLWDYTLVSTVYPSAPNQGTFTLNFRHEIRLDYSYAPMPNAEVTTGQFTEVFFLATSDNQWIGFPPGNYPTAPSRIALAAGLNYQQALAFAETTARNEDFYEFVDLGFGEFRTKERRIEWQVIEINGIKPKYPPPPPEFTKEDDDMSCCAQTKKLLNKILAKLGSDDLPASVPAYLTNPDSGNTTINNLAQFISYAVKQLDALAGKYPIDIEVQDVDLTQAGDQTQQLKIPNIAEALGEILTLLLLLRSESDANLSATIRAMIEAGASKQAATLAVEYGAANAEFLGYKGKQVNRDLPMSFDPTKERLDEILKEKVIPFKGWDNDDKNDINDLIAPILEMAAFWKAQNFRKTGADDPSDKLRALLKNSAFLAKGIDDFVSNPPRPSNLPPDQPDPPKPKDEFDSFLEDAEKGFITQPGITDPINPYGKEYARRPKIREIGTDTSDT
jgi:hypothetical protein